MAERTVYIENRCKIGYSNDYLKIEKDGETIRFHIDEFDVVIFSSLEISCSLYTLNKLSANGKTVILCNEKKLPYCNLLPLFGTGNASSRLREQLEWNETLKSAVWKYIVEEKIRNQSNALKVCGCSEVEKLSVELGDSTNAEGRFANSYFNAMFGKRFLRHNDDNINAALNYGYSVLLSLTARIIASHGYNQTMGIHHSGATNNFNLACDVVEPFRPLVDIIVKRHGDISLDTKYKCELAQVAYRDIVYKGKRYSVKYAIDLFFCDVLTCLKCGEFENNADSFGFVA